MGPSTIATVFTAIAIIMILLIIVLLVCLYIVKERRESENDIADAKRRIDAGRSERIKIACDVISAFGENTSSDRKFQHMIDSYRAIDNDADEIRWENVYIPSMQSFMRRAFKHADPMMTEAVKVANEMIIENEKQLDEARKDLMSAFDRRGRLDQQPMKTAMMIADKLSNGMMSGSDMAKRGKSLYMKMRDERQALYDKAGFTTPSELEQPIAFSDSSDSGYDMESK